MTAPRPNVAKLPKLARDYIETLEREAERLRERLSPDAAQADTFANPHEPAPQPLGEGATIQFVLSKYDDGAARDYISARLDADFLEVYANQPVAVEPVSSNVVHIRFARRSTR